MVTFIEKEFKSILNVRKFIDSWFWDKYSINPYNGCQFGCIYCDSRSEKYHLPTDFENMIIVKKNPGSMLDKCLTNARTLLPDVVSIVGTTDPYQRAEKKYENTRRCLEVLAKHRYSVLIGTKSNLSRRKVNRIPYGFLGHALRHIACRERIPVKEISPRYASQMCPYCGHTGKTNWRGYTYFKCAACGYEANRDRVASLNIALRAAPTMDMQIVPNLGLFPGGAPPSVGAFGKMKGLERQRQKTQSCKPTRFSRG